MKLLIVGNGFDLAHKLPSSYEKFKNFLKDRDKELFETLEYLYPKEALWSDFETALGHPKTSFLDYVERVFGVQPFDGAWSREVSKGFEKWAANLLLQEASDLSHNHPFLKYLDPKSLVLTFNYTKTPEEKYHIDDVLHIHGDATWLHFGFNERLVFGHEHIEGSTNSLVVATEKPVDKIIDKNRLWFDRLSRRGIDEIVVMGCSYSTVDLPYFLEIRKQCPAAKWVLFVHNENDLAKATAWSRVLPLLPAERSFQIC